MSKTKNNIESWIGIDLDGTLAYYETVPGRGLGEIGDPIPMMLEKVKRFINVGHKVKIFTARAAHPEQIPIIKEWLKKHGLGDLEITNVKDAGMKVLYDDRAIQVVRNVGITVNEFMKNIEQTLKEKK